MLLPDLLAGFSSLYCVRATLNFRWRSVFQPSGSSSCSLRKTIIGARNILEKRKKIHSLSVSILSSYLDSSPSCVAVSLSSAHHFYTCVCWRFCTRWLGIPLFVEFQCCLIHSAWLSSFGAAISVCWCNLLGGFCCFSLDNLPIDLYIVFALYCPGSLFDPGHGTKTQV